MQTARATLRKMMLSGRSKHNIRTHIVTYQKYLYLKLRFQNECSFLGWKTKFIFPAAEVVGVFDDSTKTFINLPQTTICFLLKWLWEWTNFAATVQIRCNFIDSCG